MQLRSILKYWNIPSTRVPLKSLPEEMIFCLKPVFVNYINNAVSAFSIRSSEQCAPNLNSGTCLLFHGNFQRFSETRIFNEDHGASRKFLFVSELPYIKKRWTGEVTPPFQELWARDERLRRLWEYLEFIGKFDNQLALNQRTIIYAFVDRYAVIDIRSNNKGSSLKSASRRTFERTNCNIQSWKINEIPRKNEKFFNRIFPSGAIEVRK